MVTRGITFRDHVAFVACKVRKAFHETISAIRPDGGVLYRNAVEAISDYAASVYGHRDQLRNAQRPALLGLCKAYRTTPNNVLCIITRVLPLDLLFKKRAALHTLHRGGVAVIGGETITAEGGVLTNEVRNHVREAILQLWEEEWLLPTKVLMWLTTDHGPFAAYFDRLPSSR